MKTFFKAILTMFTSINFCTIAIIITFIERREFENATGLDFERVTENAQDRQQLHEDAARISMVHRD